MPCETSTASLPYTLALARSNVTLNPRLSRLQPYPFERLRRSLAGVATTPESWQALLPPVPGGLAVRDSSGFATMLGMKTGDRMTQANGIALTGVDDVQVAFVKPLIASQPVRVAGTRDGKPSEWLFLNAGACPG